MADVEALLSRNVCNSEDEKRCGEEIGSDEFLAWACSECEKKKSTGLHPWTNHILFLRMLMKGGYPFSKNDLTLKEWVDLGMANELIESKTRIF